MAVVEQYTNRTSTQLSGGINDTVTTLTVTTTTGIPTSGQFRAIIGNEYLLVTGVSGTTWTVVRGQEGSTPTPHDDGDIITLIVTVEALLGLVRESHNGTNIGARRELNYVDSTGLTWTITDDPTNKKVDISGTITAQNGSGYDAPLGTKPLVADFSWVSQGNATASDNATGVYLRAVYSGSGSQNVHALVKTVPATPWKATMRLKNFACESGTTVGACFIQSSTNTIQAAAGIDSGAAGWRGYRWSNPTTFAGTDWSIGFPVGVDAPWFRLGDNGTNRTVEVSVDGLNWHTINTQGRTTNFTADRVGIFVNVTSSAIGGGVLCTSFSF